MARDRARSSFTVEVRRGRGPNPGADPADVGRSLWRGLDLTAELAPKPDPAAFRALTREPPPRPADTRTTAPLDAPRGRILPSLLADAPGPEPEGEAPHPERAAPRRRRAAPPRVAVAAPYTQTAAPAETPPMPAPAPASRLPSADQAARPSEPRRRRAGQAEQVLRAGERWKRRLPRACW